MGGLRRDATAAALALSLSGLRGDLEVVEVWQAPSARGALQNQWRTVGAAS